MLPIDHWGLCENHWWDSCRTSHSTIINKIFIFQDLAFKGTGKIEKTSDNMIIGIDTKFTKEINLQNGARIILAEV